MTAGPGRSWKWWVCGVLLLATMLNYMDRLTLAVTATALKSSIHLDDARYGRLEAWFSYAFAFGGILFGVVADRLGPRRLYPVVFAGWSVAGLVTPMAGWRLVTAALADPGDAGSGEFRWLLVCRTVLGFFESGHWPCALLTARNVLAENDRPLGNSILQSGASFGAVLTPLVVEGFRLFGAPWQTPFVVIGAAGLLWVPLWYQLTRSGLVDACPTAPVEVAGRPGFNLSRVTLLFMLSAVIVITISLTWQFHRAWQLKYLKEYRGYVESPGELSIANLFASIYYLVAGVGCLASGTLVSVLTRRRVSVGPARLLSFAGCAALMTLSVAVPSIDNGVWLFMALLLVGVGALAAHPLYYSLVQELPTRHMGVLSGILSALSWVAVGLMQGRMGEYVKQTGSYDLPLVVTGLAPLAGLIAFLLWTAVTKRRCENG
jgi:ACS family hexuronate transporter-like MFS transporter